MILCPHCGERIDFVEPAGLTPTQTSVLSVIRRFHSENGYAPSYREIAKGAGLKSLGQVARAVQSLEERGCIRRIPDRVRSIQIISGGAAA